MNQDPVKVDRVEWLRLFPGLSLLQAAGLGFRMRILLPAALCLLVFTARLNIAEILIDVAYSPQQLWIGFGSAAYALPEPVEAVAIGATQFLVSGVLNNPWEFVSVFWSAFVLMAFGVAMSRSAATEYCIHSRTGVFEALRFSVQHFTASLVSTGVAAGIVMLPLLFISAAAWVMESTTIGSWLVVISWPAVFVGGLLSVTVTIVCLIGWLLSLAAIGTDQCSGADALSRGINYVLSHKLWTTFYFLSVVIISGVAAQLADWLIEAGTTVVHARIDQNAVDSSTICSAWMVTIQQVPRAVHLGVFISGITIMYVLLRKTEDGVHRREIDGAVAGT